MAVFDKTPGTHLRTVDDMNTGTEAAQAAAERFMQLNARLIDRQRFAFHFPGWPVNWPFWTPVVGHEWRAWIRLHRLRTLRAYGRLAS